MMTYISVYENLKQKKLIEKTGILGFRKLYMKSRNVIPNHRIWNMYQINSRASCNIELVNMQILSANKLWRKPKVQSRMDNQETLAALCAQDTGCRQTNTNTKNTSQHKKL